MLISATIRKLYPGYSRLLIKAPGVQARLIHLTERLFIGIDEPFDVPLIVDGSFRAGFVADLHLEGGNIDASLPINIAVDTSYNRTTDSLLIETSALLATGGSFTATGPEGNYALGFEIGVTYDAGVIGNGSESATSSTFGIFPSSFDSSTSAAFTDTFAWGTIGLDWPNLSVTNESQISNTITGDNASNPFFTFSVDLDALALSLFPAGPIGDLLRFIGPDQQDPVGSFELLDVDIGTSARLVQQFVMNFLDVDGTLTFENGSQQAFTFGDDIILRNASNLDLNNDGTIGYSLSLNPDITLDNNLSVAFDASGTLVLFKNAPIVDATTINLFDEPIATVLVDDGAAFKLAFNSQTWDNLVV